MKKQLAVFVYMVLLTTLLHAVVAPNFQSAKALSVEGVITSDTVWTLADSPYLVASDVIVTSGATLTIEQRVEVRFNTGTSLIINGSLYAVGSSGNRITFTSNENEPVAGDWDGIKFYGNESSTLTLIFCVLQYAKNGITVESLGKTAIENSTISNSSLSGIHAIGIVDLLIRQNTIKLNANGISTAGSTPSGLRITDNKISNNENGIYAYAYASGDNSRIHNVTISGNTFKDNTKGIYLYSSAPPGRLANTYIYNVAISDNLMESSRYGILFLAEAWGEPGLVGNGARIYNAIISQNTISFSEYAIYVNSTSNWYSWISSVDISNNTIHSSGNGITLHAFRTPQPPFQEVPFDVTLIGNTVSANDRGVSILGDVRANFTGNSVAYNSYGIYLFSPVPSENVAQSNDIYQNTAYGIYVLQNVSVKAEYNYWGASSGPYHETLNPFGEGDRVNGNGENLDFSPFSNEPFGTINHAPFAVLQTDKIIVLVNQTVVFDGSDSSDDSSITRFFFDFGDGTDAQASLGMTKHKYAAPGIYNASLVVTDDLGVNSTNTAVEKITVTIPILVVSVFLNPPSAVSQGQTTVEVHVSDGATGVQEAFVQLTSDMSGDFEPSSGYTDSTGDFESTFTAPAVSEPVNVKITVVTSKEGYQNGSDDALLSVLTPSPSDGKGFDPSLVLFAVVVLIAAVAVVFVKKKAKAEPKNKTKAIRRRRALNRAKCSRP